MPHKQFFAQTFWYDNDDDEIIKVTLITDIKSKIKRFAVNIHKELARNVQTCIQIYPYSLKCKCYFDEIFITGCSVSCRFDNYQRSLWWKFHQIGDISIAVLKIISSLHYT